jgi:hypothetical protein
MKDHAMPVPTPITAVSSAAADLPARPKIRRLVVFGGSPAA